MPSALIPSERCYPAVRLAPQPVHRRFVHRGPLVLTTAFLKFPTPTTDRDRTVSRRSEPSSRATLIGEQPNPWDLLQPQDVTSRHRGAKPPRRYELLAAISLLSPEYLLSFERRPFHSVTAGSLCPSFLPARLVGLAVKLPCAIALYARLPSVLRAPLEASVTLLEATTPVKLPTKHCPPRRVSSRTSKGPYFNVGSANAGAPASQPPAYPTHHLPKSSAKL